MGRLQGHYGWAASAGLGLILSAIPFLGVPRAVAWLLFGVGALLLIAAVLLFAAELRHKTPSPAMGSASSHSLEELISYLKEEQGNAAIWIADEYQDVRAEMEAWTVAISRGLRVYDQEFARMFNEDDRRYTSLDLLAFLNRRLQQLGKVIAVLEQRRDAA
jgi:hypothetical protein